MGTLYKGILFTSNPDGPGVAALDAATGNVLTLIGNVAEASQLPISAPVGMAIGSKDGVDYLFVQANNRILVYRVTIG